ncbi:MAG: hypothetical protein IJ151_04250 [Bacteroidales bacterium]|nr:hypothetical protein [Bacteroidales bacterium]
MTNKMLEILSERYFSGESTREEEALLRSIVAQSPEGENEDLKAVLGLFAAGRGRVREAARRRRSFQATFAAAAAVLLLVAAGYIFRGERDVCESWINGEKITDNEVVMSGMKNDLQDIFSSSFSAQKDLEELF